MVEEERGKVEVIAQSISREICEGLAISEIGPDEDFFELGLDSLVAARLVAKLRNDFAMKIPLLLVFENPTVDALASSIAELETNYGSSGIPVGGWVKL